MLANKIRTLKSIEKILSDGEAQLSIQRVDGIWQISIDCWDEEAECSTQDKDIIIALEKAVRLWNCADYK